MFFYNMSLWHLFLEHLCTGCEDACEGFVERANVCQNLNERKNCMHIRQFTFDIAGIVCYIAAYQQKKRCETCCFRTSGVSGLSILTAGQLAADEEVSNIFLRVD